MSPVDLMLWLAAVLLVVFTFAVVIGLLLVVIGFVLSAVEVVGDRRAQRRRRAARTRVTS